uniref:Uncharacterized protein n=1 Tax=Eutreptiella gymnastica TaxID=73025 RepID=A0A6U7XBB1_9EUGL
MHTLCYRFRGASVYTRTLIIYHYFFFHLEVSKISARKKAKQMYSKFTKKILVAFMTLKASDLENGTSHYGGPSSVLYSLFNALAKLIKRVILHSEVSSSVYLDCTMSHNFRIL